MTIRFILDQKNAKLLLEHIKNFLGRGSGSVNLRGKTNEVYRYQIGAIRAIPYVIDYFETFPLKRKKAQSFQKWADIFAIVQNGEHLEEGKIELIKVLAKQINPKFM